MKTLAWIPFYSAVVEMRQGKKLESNEASLKALFN